MACAARTGSAETAGWRALRFERRGLLDRTAQTVSDSGRRGVPQQRDGGIFADARAARGFRWLQRYRENGAERSGRLSDLGVWRVERISRPAGGVCGLHARRTGRGAQRDGSEQLYREGPGYEAGPRSFDARPGAPRRRAAAEPAREAVRDCGEENYLAKASAECGGGDESCQ